MSYKKFRCYSTAINCKQAKYGSIENFTFSLPFLALTSPKFCWVCVAVTVAALQRWIPFFPFRPGLFLFLRD